MNESILDEDLAAKEVTFDNVEFAGFWIRFGASLVDMLILIPLYILNYYNLMNFKSMFVMLIITFLTAAYKPYLEWKKGGTYGKSALGIKLVDSSLNNISGEQAIKRYFPWIISLVISAILNILLFINPEFENLNDFMEIGLMLQDSPLNTISSIYNFVFIGLIGGLIFDSKKQGFHDRYAGTYCINV